MSVSLSVRPSDRMGQLGSHRTDFHEIWYLIIFRKFVEKIQVSLKSDKNNHMKKYAHLWPYLTEFFLDWEIFRTKHVQKIKTDILCVTNFFPEVVPFMR